MKRKEIKMNEPLVWELKCAFTDEKLARNICVVHLNGKKKKKYNANHCIALLLLVWTVNNKLSKNKTLKKKKLKYLKPKRSIFNWR